MGVLLIDYIITAKKLTNTMPPHPAVLKSVVSTEMARKVANDNGVACFDTFTGFKFLAEKIKEFEATGSHQYLFAFEESYGYLCGDHARDKDAVIASMLIAEMAAYYRTKGMTLYDAMQDMYKRYGYYAEETLSIVMPGVSGLTRMAELMKELRETPLTSFIIRPSGTEPKVKVYIMANGKEKAEVDAKIEKYAAAAKEIVK